MKQYNYIKASHQNVIDFDKEVANKLNIIKKRHKSKTQEKNCKNKKFQDEIIKNWKLYGFYIEPTKEQIKNEILKEQLFDEDTIDDVCLEDCLPEDYDEDEEKEI